MPEPVERASMEDCEIIVEVGREKMGWGAKPPDATFYPEFDREGGGTYLEDCPWRQLGVAEPNTNAETSPKGFFIARPRYSGTEAMVTFEVFISKPPVDGRKVPPYMRREECALYKDGGRWKLRECKVKAVT